MKTSTDRVLTTHVGSIPRPENVRALLRARLGGQAIDEAELGVRAAEAVAEVVRRQAEVGLDIVSDGEMSKTSFLAYTDERLTGFVPAAANDPSAALTGAGGPWARRVDSRREWRAFREYCWGSWQGPHLHDLGLRDIVDLVLRVRAQAYSIEAATPRHSHEWRVWEDIRLPEGKVLIPGVIAHTTAVVEHPETVAERLMNFASLVGRERVIAGADCGFAQGALFQRQHPTVMWAKFEALVQGARLASERLWG